MSRRKQNGKHTRQGPGMPVPQKMARYAHLVVQDRDNVVIATKLVELIIDLLGQGKDLILRQAIAAASPDAALFLENTIRTGASSLAHLSLTGIGEVTTELFAVPVIFRFPDNPADFAVNLGLDVTAKSFELAPQLSNPDWLIESLKTYGLGAEENGDPMHTALPYLYSAEDLLGLPASEIRSLCESFETPLLEYLGQADLVTEEMRHFRPPQASPIHWEDGRIQARYIVGACIYPTNRGLIFDRAEYIDQVDDWRCDAEGEISSVIPGDPEVGQPGALFSVLASTQQRIQQETFEQSVQQGLKDCQIDPGQISVYLSHHFWMVHGTPYTQLRLAGYRDDDSKQMVFGYRWDLQAETNMDEASDLIMEALNQCDIHRLVLIEGILSNETCPCCGEPSFRGPLTPDTDHRAHIMSSGHIH